MELIQGRGTNNLEDSIKLGKKIHKKNEKKLNKE